MVNLCSLRAGWWWMRERSACLDHLLCCSLSRLERVSGGELSCVCGAETARADRYTNRRWTLKKKETLAFISFVVYYPCAIPFLSIRSPSFIINWVLSFTLRVRSSSRRMTQWLGSVRVLDIAADGRWKNHEASCPWNLLYWSRASIWPQRQNKS